MLVGYKILMIVYTITIIIESKQLKLNKCWKGDKKNMISLVWCPWTLFLPRWVGDCERLLVLQRPAEPSGESLEARRQAGESEWERERES